MQVPTAVVPHTSPVVGEQAPLAVPNLDITGKFEDALGQLGRVVKQDQVKRQTVDINSAYVQAANEAEQQLFEAKKTAGPAAVNFTQNFNAQLEQQHQQLVEQYKKAGYDPEVVDALNNRLGAVRNTMFNRAATFQGEQVKDHAIATAELSGNQMQIYLGNHPEEINTVIDSFTHAFVNENPDLEPGDKETILARVIPGLRLSAGTAYARMHPEDTLEAYGMGTKAGTLPGTGPLQISPPKFSQPIYNTFAQLGWDDVHARAYAAVTHAESKSDPTIKGPVTQYGDQAVGINQWRAERLDALKAKHGVNWDNAANQVSFASDELRGPHGEAFRKADNIFDATVALVTQFEKPGLEGGLQDLNRAMDYAGLDGFSYKINGNDYQLLYQGKPISSAEGMQILHDKGAGPAAEGLKTPGNINLHNRPVVHNPDGSISTVRSITVTTDNGAVVIPTVVGDKVVSNEEAIAHWKKTGEHLGTFDTVAHADAFAKSLHEQQAAEYLPKEIPAPLQGLTPGDVTHVLAIAQQAVDQKKVVLQSSVKAAFDNALTAAQNGVPYAGPPITREQLTNAYGQQQGNQLYDNLQHTQQVGQFINGMKTLSADQIKAQLEGLKNTDTASATYASDNDLYAKAEAAMYKTLEMRQKDPKGYVMDAFPQVAQAFSKINFAQPDTVRAGFAALDAAYAKLGIGPSDRVVISSGEKAKLLDQYNTWNPDQKVGWWQTMLTSLPPGMRQNFLTDLGAAGKSTDAVISQALLNNPRYAEVAANVFRGLEIMKNDKTVGGNQYKYEVITKDVLKNAGRNLNPQLSAAYSEAATALFLQQGGSLAEVTVANGVPIIPQAVRQGFDRALRMVLGGSGAPDTGYYVRSTGFFSSAREATILPAGVSGKQFDNWLASAPRGTLRALSIDGTGPRDAYDHPVSEDVLRDKGTFVMTSPNHYAVKDSEGKFYQNGRGQPFVFAVDPKKFPR